MLLHLFRGFQTSMVMRPTPATPPGDLLVAVGTQEGTDQAAILVLLAGLEAVDRGQVVVGGQDSKGVHGRRPVGRFQQSPRAVPRI
jgi:ABC-type sulfate/molybdate transport systems ATPase subunit